jgi:F0F1-type ATP synthase epsilon subunit
MHLKIKGPEKLLFDGPVYGFKAVALDGDLICLDHHADYLSVLKKGMLTLFDEQMKEAQTVELEDDFILMLENNQAVVFR